MIQIPKQQLEKYLQSYGNFGMMQAKKKQTEAVDLYIQIKRLDDRCNQHNIIEEVGSCNPIISGTYFLCLPLKKESNRSNALI